MLGKEEQSLPWQDWSHWAILVLFVVYYLKPDSVVCLKQSILLTTDNWDKLLIFLVKIELVAHPLFLLLYWVSYWIKHMLITVHVLVKAEVRT
jgi:hypothetical protein